jgi:hypothetical protein
VKGAIPCLKAPVSYRYGTDKFFENTTVMFPVKTVTKTESHLSRYVIMVFRVLDWRACFELICSYQWYISHLLSLKTLLLLVGILLRFCATVYMKPRNYPEVFVLCVITSFI